MAMLYAFVVVCLSASALAQVSSPGRCPSVKGLPNFDINKFTGSWYETARYFIQNEVDGKCNVVNFGAGDNGSIESANVHVSTKTKKLVPVYVKLLPDSENPLVMHSKLPFTSDDVTSDCWFLGTDYTSYAVTYCCTNYAANHLKYAWALTRDQVPSASVMEKIHGVFDSNNLDKGQLWKTEQTHCP